MPRTLLSLTLVCALTLLSNVESRAGVAFTEAPGCFSTIRPCDTLWIVSTRGLPSCSPHAHTSRITFQVLDESGNWQRADRPSFLAADDPSVTTVFWIHGNRHSAGEARQQGMTIYRALTRCEDCSTPIRFVIFSWPSDRVDAGPIEDIRIKAERTNAQAYYLAWLVDQMQGEVSVSLTGYSFGARITTGTAHLLGGGMLCGWTLDERLHPDRLPLRAALLAPALDNHWLMPGHRHGNAMSQLEHLTVIYNSCDNVLKRYRFLYCRTSDAQALGYTGVAGLGRMGPDSERIFQYDACCTIGPKHEWHRYTGSSSLMAKVRDAVLPAAD